MKEPSEASRPERLKLLAMKLLRQKPNDPRSQRLAANLRAAAEYLIKRRKLLH